MGAMSYDRYCTEIAAQTDLLASAIKGADLTGPCRRARGVERVSFG